MPCWMRGTARSSLVFFFRALAHRNYRLFFLGQSVSLVGTWITNVATRWLVYRLTGSELLLGVASFCGQIATFVAGPFVGAWLEGADRRRVLVITQLLSMLQSVALAALALTGTITVAETLALLLFQGVVNAVDMPTRQTFAAEMVEGTEDLPNAIALNSSMVNAARLVGPSIAGVIIVAAGEGACFVLDAVSYAGVVVALLAMRLPERAAPIVKLGFRQRLIEGVRYAAKTPLIRRVLAIAATVSIFGMPYQVLLPVVATKQLGGGPRTLGLLLGAAGAGALMGTAYLAGRKAVAGIDRAIRVASIAFAGGLVALALTSRLPVAMLALVAAGFGMIVQLASCNTLLQTTVDERFRGRVMGFYTMAMLGMMPIGSLMSGALASRFGTPITIAFGATVAFVGVQALVRKLPAAA